MSFSRFLSNLGYFLVMTVFFLIDVVLIPGLIVFLVIVGVNTDIYIAGGMLIPILLGAYPITLNWFLGKATGATFYNTGYVREGRSVVDIVRDEPYYKRTIIVNFITMGLFVVSTIYFAIVMSFDFTWGLVGLLESVVGGIVYFLFAMSAIEKSGIKNKEKADFAEEFKNREPIKKVQPKKIKFNFSLCPEMEKVYIEYKDIKTTVLKMKYETIKNENYFNLLKKRDELFEILSKQIFDLFNEKKPNLIKKSTGEEEKWENIFNKPFEKLTIKQKDTLIKLLDGSPYRFEDKKMYLK